MTIDELAESSEFQEMLKDAIRKEAATEIDFYDSVDGEQTANVGEFVIDDDLAVKLTGHEERRYSGSFDGEGEFVANYIASGRDNREIPVSVPGSLSGSVTVELRGDLSSNDAEEILNGAAIEVAVTDWPREEKPQEDPPID